MFCPNCGKKISGDSTFCEQCGTKLNASNSIEAPKTENAGGFQIEDIQSLTLRDIANHLEFLGYSISRLELREDTEWVIAKHEDNNNWILQQPSEGIIFVQIRLNTGKKHTAAMEKAVNTLNSVLDITRFFYTVDEADGLVEVRIESIYTGKYVKELFSKFYEMVENDQKRLVTNEKFEAFYK